jgi:tetratricopeptide (TPR) repeat protein
MTRLEQLQQMLAQEPDDVFLQYAIAIEYFSVNDFEKALSCLKSIIANKSDYLAAYYQTGKCYEELKQFEEAKNMYEKGMELAQNQNKIKALNELREALFLLED